MRVARLAGSGPWATLAALLAVGALVGELLPAAWLDWQPALALQEPWRAWTGAFVHWSPLHLGANLLATAAVAAYGVAAQVPTRLAWAWCMAWPLTQWGLLLQPELAHYGGLSGVLHAGVAVVTLWLLTQQRGPRLAIGSAVLAGLLLKLVLEQPWGPPLRADSGWDIAVAPLAHATGAMAGMLCAAIALALVSRPAAAPAPAPPPQR